MRTSSRSSRTREASASAEPDASPWQGSASNAVTWSWSAAVAEAISSCAPDTPGQRRAIAAFLQHAPEAAHTLQVVRFLRDGRGIARKLFHGLAEMGKETIEDVVFDDLNGDPGDKDPRTPGSALTWCGDRGAIISMATHPAGPDFEPLLLEQALRAVRETGRAVELAHFDQEKPAAERFGVVERWQPGDLCGSLGGSLPASGEARTVLRRRGYKRQERDDCVTLTFVDRDWFLTRLLGAILLFGFGLLFTTCLGVLALLLPSVRAMIREAAHDLWRGRTQRWTYRFERAGLIATEEIDGKTTRSMRCPRAAIAAVGLAPRSLRDQSLQVRLFTPGSVFELPAEQSPDAASALRSIVAAWASPPTT